MWFFFFYFLAWLYVIQFIFLPYCNGFRLATLKIFWVLGMVCDLNVYYPLMSMTCSVYFLIMLFVCYSGHLSWGLALGRMIDLVFVWAIIGCLMALLVVLMEENVYEVLGLEGESFMGVLYSMWGGIVSVVVRPMSLTLRLIINLMVGHVIMFVWIVYGGDLSEFVGLSKVFKVHFVLLLVVFYEFFVFFLQSFIFSRLMGVYVGEV